MSILDKLKNKMKEATNSPVSKSIDESFPSDEELQEKKKGRRETAEKTTEWLAEKGWPTVGAVAGTAIDMSADLIPGSREEYKEALVGGGTMGTTGKLGKLAMPEASAARKLGSEEIKALKPRLEQLNQRWYGLSGEERAALGNDRLKYIKDQLKAEEIVAAEAQTAKEALRTEVRSNPKEADLSDMYKKTTAKPYEGIGGKVIEKPKAVANIESGKAVPESKLIVEEPIVKEAKFPVHEGPTVQQLKKLREQEAAINALRSRKK